MLSKCERYGGNNYEMDLFSDEFSMHIDRVALIPEMRGMGLGTKMIRRFVDEFSHEIDIFTVNTYEKNTAAVRMYKKLGFIEESESWRLYAAHV